MSALRDMLGPLADAANRLAHFQSVLNDMATDAERKCAVIDAHCHGLLSKEDTQLLFDVYDLAEA